MFSRTLDEGMHLLDLVLFLTLSLCLTSIGMFQFAEYLDTTRVKKEAEKFQQTTNALSISALQGEAEIELIVFESSYSGHTVQGQIFRYTLPSPISTKLKEPVRIRFYKSGVLTPQTIAFAHKSHECRVTLALRGRSTLTCE